MRPASRRSFVTIERPQSISKKRPRSSRLSDLFGDLPPLLAMEESKLDLILRADVLRRKRTVDSIGWLPRHVALTTEGLTLYLDDRMARPLVKFPFKARQTSVDVMKDDEGVGLLRVSTTRRQLILRFLSHDQLSRCALMMRQFIPAPPEGDSGAVIVPQLPAPLLPPPSGKLKVVIAPEDGSPPEEDCWSECLVGFADGALFWEVIGEAEGRTDIPLDRIQFVLLLDDTKFCVVAGASRYCFLTPSPDLRVEWVDALAAVMPVLAGEFESDDELLGTSGSMVVDGDEAAHSGSPGLYPSSPQPPPPPPVAPLHVFCRAGTRRSMSLFPDDDEDSEEDDKDEGDDEPPGMPATAMAVGRAHGGRRLAADVRHSPKLPAISVTEEGAGAGTDEDDEDDDDDDDDDEESDEFILDDSEEYKSAAALRPSPSSPKLPPTISPSVSRLRPTHTKSGRRRTLRSAARAIAAFQRLTRRGGGASRARSGRKRSALISLPTAPGRLWNHVHADPRAQGVVQVELRFTLAVLPPATELPLFGQPLLTLSTCSGSPGSFVGSVQPDRLPLEKKIIGMPVHLKSAEGHLTCTLVLAAPMEDDVLVHAILLDAPKGDLSEATPAEEYTFLLRPLMSVGSSVVAPGVEMNLVVSSMRMDSMSHTLLNAYGMAAATYQYSLHAVHYTVREEVVELGSGFLIPSAYLRFMLDDMTLYLEDVRQRYRGLLSAHRRGEQLPSRSSSSRLLRPRSTHGASEDTYTAKVLEFVELVESTVAEFESMQELYASMAKHVPASAYSSKRVPYSFKPSRSKHSRALRALPTNLHLLLLRVQQGGEESVYELVSGGAAAAHYHGFKEGGLLTQLRKRDKRSASAIARGIESDSSFETAIARLDSMSRLFRLRAREAICVSQLITQVLTSFLFKLQSALQSGSGDILRQYAAVGFVVSLESLLSTFGDELGMLEDLAGAMEVLRQQELTVQLQGTLVASRHLAYNVTVVEGPRAGMLVRINLESALFAMLPEQLRLPDARIRIVPLLFTQGINELQTMAIKKRDVGDVQEKINHASLALLKTYVDDYIAYLQSLDTPSERVSLLINRSFEELFRTVTSASPLEKNVAILMQSSDFVRMVNGGRITNCKSGKDRTAMSVTLESARLLSKHHKLPSSRVLEVANLMRMHGVRRYISYKNVGVKLFAFNALQRKMLPRLYRPPKGVIGAARA